MSTADSVTAVKSFFTNNTPEVPKMPTSDSIVNESGNLKGGKPDADFLKRVPNESSTSRYIQANTTDPSGKPKTQADRITRTPADKVQEAQLKSDTQKLNLMQENFLSKLLGIPMPMLITPISKDIAEPKPTDDKAQYGKIQVKENKAGFVEIRDETPGNVRKIDLHPTGTYDAMLDNGDIHQKVCGKKFTYIDNDWSVVVFGDEITVVSGSETVHIKKDKVENVNGQKTLNVDGDSFSKVGGNFIGEVVNDFATKIGGNEGRKVTGDQKENVDGTVTRKVGKNVVEQAGGNQTQVIRGGLQIAVQGKIHITSATLVAITAPKVTVN